MRPPLLLVPLALGLPGCGFLAASDGPAVLAWRAGAGYWPENSRVAVDNALAQAYDGIHVDVTLTSDEVPVQVRGPWLPHETCQTRDGAAITERQVRISDLTFEELNDGYVCGVVADPAFPDQIEARDGVAKWQDTLDALAAGNGGGRVHVHVAYVSGETPEPDVIARQVLDPFFATDPGNPLTVSTSEKKLVQAIQDHSSASGYADRFDLAVEWPAPPEDGGVQGYPLGADVGYTFGVVDPVGTAASWDVDGIVMPEAFADRQLARKARAAGLTVTVQVADTTFEQNAFEKWPIDALLTATPEPAP